MTTTEPLTQHLDGLMTLLAVVRLGRYSAAGESLGVNHSTVSRRIAALEKAVGGRVLARTPDGWETTALGARVVTAAEAVEAAVLGLNQEDGRDLHGMIRIAAPEAFTAHFAVPASIGLQRRHPGVEVELISATQRVRQSRSGVDIEIVVNRPHVHRAVAQHLRDYALGLYASPAWLERHGTPTCLADLEGHSLTYYVESLLQVDELDEAVRPLPPMVRSIRSTSVFAHCAATRLGAGIGILPDFVAKASANLGADDAGLVRILPDEYNHPLSYWAVTRPEALRSPLVSAALAALGTGSQEGV